MRNIYLIPWITNHSSQTSCKSTEEYVFIGEGPRRLNQSPIVYSPNHYLLIIILLLLVLLHYFYLDGFIEILLWLPVSLYHVPVWCSPRQSKCLHYFVFLSRWYPHFSLNRSYRSKEAKIWSDVSCAAQRDGSQSLFRDNRFSSLYIGTFKFQGRSDSITESSYFSRSPAKTETHFIVLQNSTVLQLRKLFICKA